MFPSRDYNELFEPADPQLACESTMGGPMHIESLQGHHSSKHPDGQGTRDNVLVLEHLVHLSKLLPDPQDSIERVAADPGGGVGERK